MATTEKTLITEKFIETDRYFREWRVGLDSVMGSIPTDRMAVGSTCYSAQSKALYMWDGEDWQDQTE